MVCKSHPEEVQEGTFKMTNFAVHNIEICPFCFASDLLTAYVTFDIWYKSENTLQIFSEMSGVQFSLFALWCAGKHRCLGRSLGECNLFISNAL